MREWDSTTLAELMVPDRYADIFQGRAPENRVGKTPYFQTIEYTQKDL